MTGKRCANKHNDFNKSMKLDIPLESAGTVNKKLKVDKKNNPFAGDFF